MCIFTTCCIIKFNMIHTFYKEPTNLPGTVLDTIKYAQHIITNWQLLFHHTFVRVLVLKLCVLRTPSPFLHTYLIVCAWALCPPVFMGLDGCEPPHGCWGKTLGPLQEQPRLFTASHLFYTWEDRGDCSTGEAINQIMRSSARSPRPTKSTQSCSAHLLILALGRQKQVDPRDLK